MNKKGDIEFGDEGIPGWLIALIILAIMLAAFFILKDKGANAIEYIKNMFRFGR